MAESAQAVQQGDTACPSEAAPSEEAAEPELAQPSQGCPSPCSPHPEQLLGEDQDQDEDRDQHDVGGKKIIDRTFLSLSQITAMSEENLEGVEKKMEEFLNLTQLKTSLKETILLDYYTAGFWWAKEMNFSLIQLSGFMDLLNLVLENLSSKHMTLGDNLKDLARAMAGVGETDSEERDDLNLFSIEQAKAIIDYLVTSFFKHYKAYEYLFHCRREEPVISNEIEPDQPAVSPSASATESWGSDQGDDLQEPCPEAASSEVDAVAGVTAEDEKSAVCEILNEIIGNLEADINKKLRMQEEA